MPTLPIVEHLDVFEDLLLGFVSGGIVPMVHELPLERSKETFDARVVQAVAFAAHTGNKAIFSESVLVACRGILTAAVRMVQEPYPGSSVHHGHQEGLLRQLTR